MYSFLRNILTLLDVPSGSVHVYLYFLQGLVNKLIVRKLYLIVQIKFQASPKFLTKHRRES